jgi:hypothetical protein
MVVKSPYSAVRGRDKTDSLSTFYRLHGKRPPCEKEKENEDTSATKSNLYIIGKRFA